MQKKTIQKVLSKKIESFIESIEDANLKSILKNKVVVTGGCIASMLLKEKVNDYDVYFRDFETAVAVAQYYMDIFNKEHAPGVKFDPKCLEEKRIKLIIKSIGVAGEMIDNEDYFEARGVDDPEMMDEDTDEKPEKDEEQKKFQPKFISSNAITLTNKLQLVMRFYGEPDKLHENYDFIHCMNYWTSWDKKVVLRPEALEALLSKQLQYVGSKYPLCSIIRTRKFLKRGWWINAGQYLKMALQVSNLDLNNIDVLEDQLIGVDTAYFEWLIASLREKGGEKVDTQYITILIDKMF